LLEPGRSTATEALFGRHDSGRALAQESVRRSIGSSTTTLPAAGAITNDGPQILTTP